MLSLALLFAAFDTSLSAPVIGHDHVESAIPLTFVGREPQPSTDVERFRTKYDIIWGCLVTIFACTRVAVHPNVPIQKQPGFWRLTVRTSIVMCALFAPEVITTWALRQCIGARKHRDQYNERFFPDLKPKSIWEYIKEWFVQPEDNRTDGRWTLTHGFLLEMGGITMDGDILYDVHSLTKPIEISEEQINDKSKGDFLTKLFAVLQTSWFIAQCIARWTTQLPVIELEVITLGFAFLNIITYAFWWYKPQSMHVPIKIRKDDEVEFRQVWRKPVEEERSEEGVKEDESQSGNPQPVEEAGKLGNNGSQSGSPQLVEEARDVNDGSQSAKSSQPHKPRSRWWSLVEILVLVPILGLGFTLAIPFGICVVIGIPLVFMLLNLRDALPIYSSQGTVTSWKTIITLCSASVVFGGIHLIPLWMTSFPSSAERLLWKICSISITAIPVHFKLFLAGCIHRHFKFRIPSEPEDPAYVDVLDVSLVFSGMGYIAARYILLGVACSTLRAIPQDAYQNVVWTDFMPHF